MNEPVIPPEENVVMGKHAPSLETGHAGPDTAGSRDDAWDEEEFIAQLEKPTWRDRMSRPFYTALHLVKDIPLRCRARFIVRCYLVKMPRLNKWSWHHTATRLLHANMELVRQFVDNEKPFDGVGWDSGHEDRVAAKTMMEIYAWWKDYPRRRKEADDASDAWVRPAGRRRESNQELRRIVELHQRLHEEETAMLHKVIDIGGVLWM